MKEQHLVKPIDVVIEDPHVMGGLPVFRGTRVPIANVLASLKAGFNLEQLREAYPFLTQEMVDAAHSYSPSNSAAPARQWFGNGLRLLMSRERARRA